MVVTRERDRGGRRGNKRIKLVKQERCEESREGTDNTILFFPFFVDVL